MTKQARKYTEDLPGAGTLLGTELVTVERGKVKYKTTFGGSGGLSWVVKSGAYTMAAGEGVLCLSDGAGTGYSITAPATIAANDVLVVHNANETDLVTFARNGHTLRYKGVDVADDVTIAPGETLYIVCSDATNMEII